jgi:hypothetical protein
MPEIISRKDAMALGLPRYYSARPCRHDHLAEHFVSGGCCICVLDRTKRSREKARTKPKGQYRRIKRLPIVRGVIIEAREYQWQVRSYDGAEFTIDIGDVHAYTQRRELHLMIPGAVVEFKLADGEFPQNVVVT